MTWDDAETVPADCATGGNRTHVVGETDFVADAICYNHVVLVPLLLLLR